MHMNGIGEMNEKKKWCEERIRIAFSEAGLGAPLVEVDVTEQYPFLKITVSGEDAKRIANEVCNREFQDVPCKISIDNS